MSAPLVVAGNWKMHHGPAATRDYLRRLREEPRNPEGPRLLLFPPSLALTAAVEVRGANGYPELGVQNIHWEEEGAFTGEVSAAMAAEAGATHTLVGHSERRQLFRESDAEVARKAAAALRGGLTPVICVGETLRERRDGRLEAVLLRQLDTVLQLLAPVPAFLLAYEPVWAIGTGETATPDDAAEAHGILRRRLRTALGEGKAAAISILYGGSVKPDNAAELMEATDVDGVLVGGASLDPVSMARIAAAAPSRR